MNLYTPRFGWETVGGAVAEAPEVLQHNGKTFLIYSASYCSTPDYKLGMLTLTGGDPMNSSAWTRAANPSSSPGHRAQVIEPRSSSPGHRGRPAEAWYENAPPG